MQVNTEIIFDRETGCVTAHIAGRVRKHFGRLEVTHFTSDLILTPQEKEEAEETLKEHARYDGPPSEEEPDTKRPH